MRQILATITALLVSTANAWTLQESVDVMTDKVTRQAVVAATDGSTLTLLRRSDDSVWGYVKLSGMNQFMVNERLMMRIDKDKPVEFNDDLQRLMTKLRKPMPSWEWNPSLVGFHIWHGNPAQGCGMIKRLIESSTVLVRYHPNQSVTRDILFNTDSNRHLIGEALGLEVAQCTGAN
ncbi:hypothetical protein [Rhodoferax sp.]|uniref:hypothetical protein n=1 Tax=Rhodoferax sp. TaxID=50421 RepID=UPI002730966B|nr:hypothetical protein [Rhodoferax sp.]MDP1528250.1 hypothetical protein [Rhodoferax sp.]MDP1945019.1 hypothetical protein [Rhodoferax sp.]MDP2443061.1 hypothetical protein [Rhodoferax sp.]MDP3866658.1 hypothetical protein [Rhodoferax sp.]MDZ4206586.1 hypothetical protein [Rhodoferax sp.]